ncbi:MAG: hypothetical protein COA43_04505 [Robiginitomaculum sp.]|nr:MAG: hypothetical protein COA43_04505 [Robiginitomaculum sp.]
MLYKFGNIRLDTVNFRLTNNGDECAVEPQVFDLLVYLVQHRDRVLTRDEIFDNVWQGRHVSDTSLSNHIKTARRILGDTAQEQNMIKTIRGRGYQFVCETQERPHNSRIFPKPKKTNTIMFITTIVSLLIVIGFLILNPRRLDQENEYVGIQRLETIAVLPLINASTNAEIDFLGFALTDQIIGRLNYIEEISVRPSALVRQFKGMKQSPVDIGKTLGVDYILSGNYLKHEDKIRLNIEFINVSTHELIWREDIELEYANVFALQDAVAKITYDRFNLKQKESPARQHKNPLSVHPIAYEYYLRGIAYPLTEKGDALAIAMLKQSIGLENGFAPAYAELGRRMHQLSAHGISGTQSVNEAETHLLKALSLDPRSLNALANLTLLYTDTGRLLKALKTSRKMLEINPNYADAYFSLGYVYRYAGQLDLSIQMMEKAISIDPHNKKFRSAGASYYSVGRYEEAHKIFDLDAGTAFTLSWHAILYHRQGKVEKAVEYFDKAIAVAPDGYFARDSKAYKLAMLGKMDEGLNAVRRLENTFITDVEVRYFWALYYSALGDRDNSIRILREVVEAGYYNLPAFDSDPFLDFIRHDPEFIKIMSLADNGRKAFKTASQVLK